MAAKLMCLLILQGWSNLVMADLPPSAFWAATPLLQMETGLEECERSLGLTVRHRRASGTEQTFRESLVEQEEYTYSLYSSGGPVCIMAETEATFMLDYHTLRYGLRTAVVKLPKDPLVSGSCLKHNGDTAVLSLMWGVFNFSLVFTENAEGNSYYLNKAVLRFNQSLDVFYDATYRGPVVLQTAKDLNYYFTPLGKSYVCREGRDQGPLALLNLDEEVVGNLTLWNSRFQPFVKRAKGKWGPESHCLPRDTQIMREEVVPYVTASIFGCIVIALMVGYGLYRKLNVAKTEYAFYDQEMEIAQQQMLSNLETHEETTKVRGEEEANFAQVSAPYTVEENAVEEKNMKNPFKQQEHKSAQNNPFNQKTMG